MSRTCLQCGESEAAVRLSQQRRDPIFCASVDYWGETEWEMPRHRFRPWSDRELIESWGVLPRFVDRYRRIRSAWEISPEHRFPRLQVEE